MKTRSSINIGCSILFTIPISIIIFLCVIVIGQDSFYMKFGICEDTGYNTGLFIGKNDCNHIQNTTQVLCCTYYIEYDEGPCTMIKCEDVTDLYYQLSSNILKKILIMRIIVILIISFILLSIIIFFICKSKYDRKSIPYKKIVESQLL